MVIILEKIWIRFTQIKLKLASNSYQIFGSLKRFHFTIDKIKYNAYKS